MLHTNHPPLPAHLVALRIEANQRIDEFFQHQHDWAESSINYLAQRLIHETYPDLDADDVMLLVGSIEREHKIRADEAARMDEIVTQYSNALY